MNFRRTVVLVASGVNALIVVLWYALFVADSGTVSPLDLTLLIALLVAAGVVTHGIQRNILRRRLYKPLQEIQKTTQAISEGASSGRVAVSELSEVEVREVATAINRLARKATNDIDEMRRLERVRSEFVGNVSHELVARRLLVCI